MGRFAARPIHAALAMIQSGTCRLWWCVHPDKEERKTGQMDTEALLSAPLTLHGPAGSFIQNIINIHLTLNCYLVKVKYNPTVFTISFYYYNQTSSDFQGNLSKILHDFPCAVSYYSTFCIWFYTLNKTACSAFRNRLHAYRPRACLYSSVLRILPTAEKDILSISKMLLAISRTLSQVTASKPAEISSSLMARP